MTNPRPAGRPPRNPTPEEAADFARRHAAGESLDSLCGLYRIDRRIATRWRAALGLAAHPPGRRSENLLGRRIGRLVVRAMVGREPVGPDGRSWPVWSCDCDCGTTDFRVAGWSLAANPPKATMCRRCLSEWSAANVMPPVAKICRRCQRPFIGFRARRFCARCQVVRRLKCGPPVRRRARPKVRLVP